jgi:amidophosphoribosyltransferase
VPELTPDAVRPVEVDLGDEPLDRLHEECGIFGVYGPGEDVANLTYFGLYALQHRGQESAGIAVSDGEWIRIHKDIGLVAQVFDQDDLLDMRGHISVGHTRYSTTGSTRLPNAQPMLVEHGQLNAIAYGHNGNLVNAAELRNDLVEQGVDFTTTTDTEVIGAVMSRTPGDSLEVVLRRALPRLEGAYCLLLCSRTQLAAARDPLGIRPLCIGRLGRADAPGGAGYILASETCALDVVGAQFVREVEPGEIVVIDERGLRSSRIPRPVPRHAMCSFEFIYFARPDSVIMGRQLYEARVEMGRELAREAPVDADIVISLPDSGTPAAVGYAEAAGIPYVEGMIKSRYITRTFIQPNQRLREAGIRLKFNPMRHVLKDKRVVLVDDSIVRGTTSKRIVEELRRAGAKEVHMRIASPPIVWPCFMGIDIASRGELIAAHRTEEEVGCVIGADTLRYLSIPGLKRAMGEKGGEGFCFACFDGAYPLQVPQQLEMDKLALEIPLTSQIN